MAIRSRSRRPGKHSPDRRSPIRNPKSQAPNPKQVLNSKLQREPVTKVFFGYWSLGFPWSLGFGIWDFGGPPCLKNQPRNCVDTIQSLNHVPPPHEMAFFAFARGDHFRWGGFF